jgi:hypothetical protein
VTARDRMRWTAELACGCSDGGECGYPTSAYIDVGDLDRELRGGEPLSEPNRRRVAQARARKRAVEAHAARLGVDLPATTDTASAPEPGDRGSRGAPGSGGGGRPRTCEHDNRRSRTINRYGRPYTVTYCRTCESKRTRDRRRRDRAELLRLRERYQA